jgi:hypothetical protein
MIILHSQHDERSRKFVEQFGEGNEIISYPECIRRFPWIRAFPSVILDVPAHSVPAGWFHPEQKAYNVPAHEELADTPEDWELVCKSQEFIDEWVKVSPPGGGT